VRFDIGHLTNPIEGIGPVQFFLTPGPAFWQAIKRFVTPKAKQQT